ncbi:MAG TPA: hypothetical protein VK324_18350 [Tepidisphaeraceae bacterium]|nr:hypothetical protein [Tepidisphaeraceae bacterium]
MGKTWLPAKDAAFRNFVVQAAAVLGPAYAAYGVPQSIAQLLTSQTAKFVSDYEAATARETRGVMSILEKKLSRDALTKTLRQAVAMVRANPAVTPQMRVAIGLELPDEVPSVRLATLDVPSLSVKRVDGRIVTAVIGDPASPKRRGKARGAIGTVVMSYVGPTPPTGSAGWHWEGCSGRTEVEIAFPESVAPGTQVWLTAMWLDGRKIAGPACTPVSTYLSFGGVQPMDEVG